MVGEFLVIIDEDSKIVVNWKLCLMDIGKTTMREEKYGDVKNG